MNTWTQHKIEVEYKLILFQQMHQSCEEPTRVNGRSLCPYCGLPWSKHPDHYEVGYDGEPFLKRACDGSLKKL